MCCVAVLRVRLVRRKRKSFTVRGQDRRLQWFGRSRTGISLSKCGRTSSRTSRAGTCTIRFGCTRRSHIRWRTSWCTLCHTMSLHRTRACIGLIARRSRSSRIRWGIACCTSLRSTPSHRCMTLFLDRRFRPRTQSHIVVCTSFPTCPPHSCYSCPTFGRTRSWHMLNCTFASSLIGSNPPGSRRSIARC